MIPAENQQIVHLTSSTIITRKELPEWPKTLPMTTFRPSNHHLAFHLQIPSRIGPVVGNRNQRNPTAEGRFGSAFSVQTAFKTKVNKMNRIEKLIAGWYRVDDDWCSSFSNHNRTWWHYLFVSDKTISHRRKIRCREAGFPATHDSVVSGSKRLLTTTQTCSTRKNSLEEKLWDAAWNIHLRKRNGNTCSRARLMIQLRLPGPTGMRLLAPKYLTKLRPQTYKYWNIQYLKYSSEKKKRLYMHSATGSNRW